MRLKLIGAKSSSASCLRRRRTLGEPHDLEFLPKGLHNIGQAKMTARLAEVVAAVDRRPTMRDRAGLRAVQQRAGVGLAATDIPLVVPQAHDCITLFRRQRPVCRLFWHDPGVSSKHRLDRTRQRRRAGCHPDAIQNRNGMTQWYEDLVAKYSRRAARDSSGRSCRRPTRNYGSTPFIPHGASSPTTVWHTRKRFAARGWKCDRVPGDMRLITALVNGPWKR